MGSLLPLQMTQPEPSSSRGGDPICFGISVLFDWWSLGCKICANLPTESPERLLLLALVWLASQPTLANFANPGEMWLTAFTPPVASPHRDKVG